MKDKRKEGSTGKVVQSGYEGQKEGGQRGKSRSKVVMKDKRKEVSAGKVVQKGYEGQNAEGKQAKSVRSRVLICKVDN